MAPKLADFRSKIIQNAELFERVAAVHDSDEVAGLRPDQQRLVQLAYDEFARNGATLDGAAKERYAAINQRLAELYTAVRQQRPGRRGGLRPLPGREPARRASRVVRPGRRGGRRAERGHAGEYAVTNTRSSMDPFLTYSDERDLREQVWRTYYNRGDNGDEHDNNAIITEILKLRDERVELLGYDNYAQWRLEDRMAKTPERAMRADGGGVAGGAGAGRRGGRRHAGGGGRAEGSSADITIAPWDYRYYAEKVRKAKYDLDSDEVKQYLQLDKLREAMFFVAGELFGFRVHAGARGHRAGLPPGRDRVWEVTDRDSGELVGVWYLDPFARTGKRSGAWATTYRGHESFDGDRGRCSSRTTPTSSRAPRASRCWSPGTTPRPCSTSSATPSTPSRRTSPTRRSTAACATTPSSSRSSSSAGCSPTR